MGELYRFFTSNYVQSLPYILKTVSVAYTFTTTGITMFHDNQGVLLKTV